MYDELYQAAEALANHDPSAFGMQIGRLLQSLRASGCKTKACVIIQGLLGVLQIESADFAACSSDADNAFVQIEDAASAISQKNYLAGAHDLANSVAYFAKAVSSCGVSDVAKTLEDAATSLATLPLPLTSEA